MGDGFLLVIILLLGIALLVAVGAVVLQKWNLAKLNQQLQDILDQFGTNEMLRTHLPGVELNTFIANINRLISLFKKEEQESIRKNKDLKQEITNISHDIRTPLTSIKGFSELLQDPQLSNLEKDEYLSIIQKKVDTLLRLADTFYEISLLDSDEEEPLLECFPLGDILVESLLTFQKDFESRNIDVTIDENNLFSTVYADKKDTERIILNLIQNILRYTDSFFQVTIVNEERDFCILQLRNDTHLITNQLLDKIFERSYTGDPSRQKGQTGLGLYIVKKLSERQGGWVKANHSDNIFLIEIGFRKL